MKIESPEGKGISRRARQRRERRESVLPEPTPYQLLILRSMQGRPMFSGVDKVTKANRRVVGRRAKAARKLNRGNR